MIAKLYSIGHMSAVICKAVTTLAHIAHSKFAFITIMSYYTSSVNAHNRAQAGLRPNKEPEKKLFVTIYHNDVRYHERLGVIGIGVGDDQRKLTAERICINPIT